MHRLFNQRGTCTGFTSPVSTMVGRALFIGALLFSQANTVMAHSNHKSMKPAGNLLTQNIPQDLGEPGLRNPGSGRLVPQIQMNELAARPKPIHANQCEVDFSAPDALALTESSLWFDRVYVPWWQNCDNQRYVDIRPLQYSHFHLGFSNDHIEPCASNEQAFPAQVDDDMNCQLADIETEPRTYLTTHSTGSILGVRVYDINSDRTPFNLTAIRVVGNAAIDLCFNHSLAPHTEWKAGQVPAEGEEAGWYCWEDIGHGYWNLSPWLSHVVDVRVTASNGGNFSVDDLMFSW